MPYIRIDNREKFLDFHDRIIDVVHAIFVKNKQRGNDPELLFQQIQLFSTNPCGFVLLHLAEDGETVDGLMVAMAVPVPGESWIEVINIWGPRLANKIKYEAFSMVTEWGKEHCGAKRIYTMITRSPDRFFKYFHEPLGFKKIGYILEAEI